MADFLNNLNTNNTAPIPRIGYINSEATRKYKNRKRNNSPPDVNLIFIYLLGVMSCKWWINHNKKRIRIHLPESKRYMALALKKAWGGTVSNSNNSTHRRILWQATSTKSFLKIEEAAKSVKSWLPPEFYKQLMSFIKVFLNQT